MADRTQDKEWEAPDGRDGYASIDEDGDVAIAEYKSPTAPCFGLTRTDALSLARWILDTVSQETVNG